jgi:hypothetical protein
LKNVFLVMVQMMASSVWLARNLYKINVLRRPLIIEWSRNLSFDLAIAGEYDPAGSIVSALKVAAFDGANYLGDFDPATGALATFLWTPSPTAYGSGDLAINVSDSRGTAVPEPSDMLLMAIGLAAMMLVLRRRGRSVVSREGERESLIGLAA